MTRLAGRLARRAAVGVGAVAACLLVAAAIRLAWVPSPRKAHYELPREEVAVPSDAFSIARGGHLAASVAVCTVCHGDNLGGRLAFDHPLLGRGYTPNLTRGRGGIGASYQISDWVRALRHGVDRQGRALLFMPVDHYRHLSDEDLGALVAYIRSLPPVDNEQPGLQLSRLALWMIDLGLSGDVVRAAKIDHFAPRSAPPADPGAYLVQIGGCTFCHGETLRGGRGLEPGAPPGPDLTRGGRWAGRDFAAFVASMRNGTTADGRAIDPKFMPWQGYRRMTDAELRAVWDYLRALPVR